ncbi:hypothetical protein GGR54DRAFT_208828 [Hypoxylon sp. NC1633]|nr:hypothetical protein GGR54DRAFT_208828 [Hypoxylon sp. NC1633]
MHVATLLAATLLAAGMSVGAPVDLGSTNNGSASSTIVTGNATTDGTEGPPLLTRYRCHPNFQLGDKLSYDDTWLLKDCYKWMLHGHWVKDPERCVGTDKFLQSYGHHWQNPDDCTNACRECIEGAIGAGIPNARCYKSAGVSAECNVMYV